MSSESTTTLDTASRPAPFDTLAEAYDEQFTDSLIGRAQRQAVWRELDHLFRPGQRILEINCGTGVDAMYLARRDVEVVACDSSSRMIKVARERLCRAELASGLGAVLRAKVRFEILATEEIGKLQDSEASFDGVLSNFAGLNCVEDLRAVARDLARLSRPGAVVALCLFGRFCMWEILWHLGHGNPRKAFRRFCSEGSLAQPADGVMVRVRYPSVRKITGTFAPHFRLRGWKGVGVAVPPSYVEPWARRFPQVLSFLANADRWLGRCPLIRAMGDHLLVAFERTHA